MMYVQLELTVAAVDYVSKEPLILIDTDTELIPTLCLDSTKTAIVKHEIHNLFAEYLNCDASWAKLKLVDFDQEGEKLIMYYSAIVPADVDLLRGKFVKISEITDTKTLALFGKAAQTL